MNIHDYPSKHNLSRRASVESPTNQPAKRRYISYGVMLKAYYSHGFKVSPLLESVNIIQDRCRAWGLLSDNEFLLQFDENKESFVVDSFDNTIIGKLTWKDKIRRLFKKHDL